MNHNISIVVNTKYFKGMQNNIYNANVHIFKTTSIILRNINNYIQYLPAKANK